MKAPHQINIIKILQRIKWLLNKEAYISTYMQIINTWPKGLAYTIENLHKWAYKIMFYSLFTNLLKNFSSRLVEVYCVTNILTEKQINVLRELSYNIPVLCYGLRTDYKTKLFEGSKRLMEISDSIEEIKTTCYFCNRKAIINLKHKKGIIIKDGTNDIDLGTEDKYLCSCHECYNKKSII